MIPNLPNLLANIFSKDTRGTIGDLIAIFTLLVATGTVVGWVWTKFLQRHLLEGIQHIVTKSIEPVVEDVAELKTRVEVIENRPN